MNALQALFLLHAGLPRCGPGSDDATREALSRLPDLPERPRVLDIGCGPGKQTLVLADALRSPVVGLDIFPPYVQQLTEDAFKRGLGAFVEGRVATLFDIQDPPGSYDLVWSEGTIFIPTFRKGLRLWKPLLRPGGYLVVSDMSWLRADGPDEIRSFWGEGYPTMTDVAGNRLIAREEGFELVDDFPLPAQDWWDNYYDPLTERIKALRPGAEGAMAATMDATLVEMEMFRKYSEYCGYVFYLLRVPGPEGACR